MYLLSLIGRTSAYSWCQMPLVERACNIIANINIVRYVSILNITGKYPDTCDIQHTLGPITSNMTYTYAANHTSIVFLT